MSLKISSFEEFSALMSHLKKKKKQYLWIFISLFFFICHFYAVARCDNPNLLTIFCTKGDTKLIWKSVPGIWKVKWHRNGNLKLKEAYELKKRSCTQLMFLKLNISLICKSHFDDSGGEKVGSLHPCFYFFMDYE